MSVILKEGYNEKGQIEFYLLDWINMMILIKLIQF